jgi:hypothetical protein
MSDITAIIYAEETAEFALTDVFEPSVFYFATPTDEVTISASVSPPVPFWASVSDFSPTVWTPVATI